MRIHNSICKLFCLIMRMCNEAETGASACLEDGHDTSTEQVGQKFQDNTDHTIRMSHVTEVNSSSRTFLRSKKTREFHYLLFVA